MTNVITFRPRELCFTQQDRAELQRWSTKAAACCRWYVQRDSQGGLVSSTEDGDEYCVLSAGSETADGVFTVMPTRGGWTLLTAEGNTEGGYQSLAEALAAVCKA